MSTNIQQNIVIQSIKWIWHQLKIVWNFLIRLVGGFFVVTIILLILGGVLSRGRDAGPDRSVVIEGDMISQGEIVLLDLSGMIVERAQADPFSFDSQVISSYSLQRTLDDLEQDTQVKGVILRINSPGGSVLASDLAYQAVTHFAQTKPVVASLSESAVSGGYYIAAGADKIVAHPSSMIGSIGVIGYFPNAAELLDTLGIHIDVISTGQYKDAGSPHRSLRTQERDMVQTIVDQALDEFVTAVAANRDLSEDQVRELADGRIFSGRDSVELGLVDQLGGVHEAFDIMKELTGLDSPALTEEKPASFFDALFSAHGGFGKLFVQFLGMNQFTQQINQVQNLIPNQGIYYVSEI